MLKKSFKTEFKQSFSKKRKKAKNSCEDNLEEAGFNKISAENPDQHESKKTFAANANDHESTELLETTLRKNASATGEKEFFQQNTSTRADQESTIIDTEKSMKNEKSATKKMEYRKSKKDRQKETKKMKTSIRKKKSESSANKVKEVTDKKLTEDAQGSNAEVPGDKYETTKMIDAQKFDSALGETKIAQHNADTQHSKKSKTVSTKKKVIKQKVEFTVDGSTQIKNHKTSFQNEKTGSKRNKFKQTEKDDPKEHKKSKFSLRRKKSKSEGKVQEATEKTFAKDYQESTSAHDLEGESTKLLAVDQQKDHPATGEKRFSRQIVHSKRENSVTMHTEKSATKTNIELIFDESIHTEYNETALKKEKSENIGKEFKSTKKGRQKELKKVKTSRWNKKPKFSESLVEEATKDTAAKERQESVAEVSSVEDETARLLETEPQKNDSAAGEKQLTQQNTLIQRSQRVNFVDTEKNVNESKQIENEIPLKEEHMESKKSEFKRNRKSKLLSSFRSSKKKPVTNSENVPASNLTSIPELSNQLSEVAEIVQANVQKSIRREKNLHVLLAKTEEMENQAQDFLVVSKQTRVREEWKGKCCGLCFLCCRCCWRKGGCCMYKQNFNYARRKSSRKDQLL